MSEIGRSVPRRDGPLKVTGAAPYSVDYRIPGMLHTHAVRSPYPHAQILHVDVREAERLPGVVVLTRDDLSPDRSYFGPVLKDESIVAIDRVRFIGDIVAAVAAEDMGTAEEAAQLIRVEYEPLPAVMDPLEALEPDAPLLHERLQEEAVAESTAQSIQPGLESLQGFAQGNLCGSYHFEVGDVELGLAEADLVFSDVYRVPPIQHAHMEPHAAVAQWEGPRLVLRCSSQDPWVVRTEMAELFQIPGNHVRVIVPYLGGGYGAKLYPRIEPVVAALARKARRPVGWTLTREEEFLTVTRHGAVVEIVTGVSRDGSLVARRMRVVYDAGAYAEISPRVAAQNGPVAAGPYRIPNVSVDCLTVYTNKPPAGAFRGFGVPQIAWAYESQMDDIARALGRSPVDLRRQNLYQEGQRYLTGETLHGVGVTRCLDLVAEAIGADAPPIDPGAGAAQRAAVRGVGVACTVKSTMTPSNSAAALRLDADGTLQVLTSGVEIGQGTTTVMAQIAAEAIGLPVERVNVVLPDTDVTPFDHGTKSSRLTFTVGRAVWAAAIKIRSQLLDLAAETLEVAPGDLEIADGQVWVRGTERSLDLRDVFRRTFGLAVGSLHSHEVFQTTGGLDPHTYQGKDSAFWMWGAVAAEVEVDRETGKVHVVRLVSAMDTGTTLNPAQCHLQNEGSVVMGLGSALLEELVFDEGQLVNGSFASYMVPSFEDFPARFESMLVEAPHPDGPFGAKGVGESVLPAVAPAIGNAVADALGGLRTKALPIRADSVLRLLEAERGGGEDATQRG